MQARCFCKTHGKLGMNDVVIKNNTPVCNKCFAILEFADVKPRKVK
jgi:hypothetical protein